MINNAIALKLYGKLSNSSHYVIETTKIFYATDINSECKQVLTGICNMLMEGNPFFKDNKTIASDLHTSPRTISRVLNKLVSQKYISFSENKKDNYRYISHINLQKTGLQGSYKPIKATINPYKSRNNYHKIIHKDKRTKVVNNKEIKHNVSTVNHKTENHRSYNLSDQQKLELSSAINVAAKLFPNYSKKSARNGIMRQYIKNKKNMKSLNFRQVQFALWIAKYRITIQKIGINTPIAYACSMATDNVNDLYKRSSKDRQLVHNNYVKYEHKKLDEEYKIDGKCYLWARPDKFYKDVKHRLHTHQFTIEQYHYYCKQYSKHGNIYGDKF